MMNFWQFSTAGCNKCLNTPSVNWWKGVSRTSSKTTDPDSSDSWLFSLVLKAADDHSHFQTSVRPESVDWRRRRRVDSLWPEWLCPGLAGRLTVCASGKRQKIFPGIFFLQKISIVVFFRSLSSKRAPLDIASPCWKQYRLSGWEKDFE